MTASLPVPHDPFPHEPDGAESAEQASGPAPSGPSPVVALPPKPTVPAEEAAARGGSAVAGAVPADKPAPPRKPRAPRSSTAKARATPSTGRAPRTTGGSGAAAPKAPARKTAVKPGATSGTRPTTTRPPTPPAALDPGHPPPLPDEVVIPPKPPLPTTGVSADEASAVETARDAKPDDEPEASAEAVVDVAPSSEETVTVERHVEDAPAAEEAPAVEDAPVAAEDAPVVDEAPVVDDAAVIDDAAALAAVLGEGREAAASVDESAAVLRVRGITKIFGDTPAVDGIDLTVPVGSFYGLVGPNGAGKTTTLSMIAGLLRPDRGTIEVNGIDAQRDPAGAKRAMGVLPDRLRTFDRLTGRQLLYYYGILRGLAPSVVESRTVDLARAFDLTDALGRVVSDYSAGMAKKVMLAGAMIHSPRLLVLDEPFEAVDPVSSAVILDILGAYVAHGGTVILSSHGMELVERVCSRVAVIVAGQVLAEGTVDEVRGEMTLEQRFIELAGGLSDVEGLEWLHTFSD